MVHSQLVINQSGKKCISCTRRENKSTQVDYKPFSSITCSQSAVFISRSRSFLCLTHDWLITGTWLSLWPLARKRRSCWSNQSGTVCTKFGLPWGQVQGNFHLWARRPLKIGFRFTFCFFVSRIRAAENGESCQFARKVGRQLCSISRGVLQAAVITKPMLSLQCDDSNEIQISFFQMQARPLSCWNAIMKS